MRNQLTPTRANAIAIMASVISMSCTLGSAHADAIEEFYRGKTIRMYINSTPGAGYDVYARLVARHMGNHIPGKPTVVPQNMPGAGGRAAAAYIYNVAAKDGLSLAALNRSVALAQAMGDPGIMFDNAKFNWIGSPEFDNSTLATWHTSGVRTIEEAKVKEVTVGTTGDGNSSIYPRAMNIVLGTKFKIIRGYPGGNEVNLAMESGEVGGRGDNAWGSWKSARPEWLSERKINILVQIGLQKVHDLPDVPLLLDLATNPDDHALLKLLSAPPALGHPIVTSPDVPPERVAALRAAFDAAIKDPVLREEAGRIKRDISPVSGAELAKIVADILATPKPIRNRLASMMLGPESK
jgi:tripartite-type tricarboxylate transporter receptor subunit TctC